MTKKEQIKILKEAIKKIEQTADVVGGATSENFLLQEIAEIKKDASEALYRVELG